MASNGTNYGTLGFAVRDTGSLFLVLGMKPGQLRESGLIMQMQNLYALVMLRHQSILVEGIMCLLRAIWSPRSTGKSTNRV